MYRGRSREESDGYDHDGRFLEAEGAIMRATGVDPNGTGEASSSSCSSAGVDNETVILSLKERVRWLEQRLCEKVVRAPFVWSMFFLVCSLDVFGSSHEPLEWTRNFWL